MPPSRYAATPEAELLVVQQAARQVTQTTDSSQSIQAILRLLSELLGLNRGRVLLPNERSGSLRIAHAYGLTQEERDRGQYAIGEGISGRVFKSGQLALIQNIDEEPTYLARAVDRAVLPNEAVAFIAVPIVLDEKPIGVLAVHRLRKRERPFQRDVALLQVISTFIGQTLRIQQLIDDRTSELMSENQLLRNRLEARGARYGIMGQSPALQAAIQQAIQVAATGTTVLLLGESGTGKERFARMQHLASKRANGPFVSINCAAIPASLIESELFGHEKGAFTGATGMKKGKVELASGGTLFLDEIGDLDMDLQAKLLRVLENRVIQRVGGHKDIEVDVRIVAATHKNLQEAVNQNRFRLDLFYRINVFPIRLPPLRARLGDIPILARHFLNAANQEYGRAHGFGAGALEAMERYRWPGNIRQLENVVKRCVLLSHEKTIDRTLVEDVLVEEDGIAGATPPEAGPLAGQPAARATAGTSIASPPASPAASYPGHAQPGAQPGTQHGVSGRTLGGHRYPGPFPDGVRPYAKVRADEADDILAALEQNLGNETRAAIQLGLTPRQLRYRMKKLGLDPERSE